MKYIILRLIIFLILISPISLLAQDVILYKDGTEKKAKILKIGSDKIEYKRYSNLNGPSYSVNISNIFMIRYENGEKDVFGKIETSTPSKTRRPIPTSNSKNCQHLQDTIQFVSNKYMWVCSSCNMSLRYASQQEVQLILKGAPIKRIDGTLASPCGKEPQPPPKFNNPQWKISKEYKAYKREHVKWRYCMEGN